MGVPEAAVSPAGWAAGSTCSLRASISALICATTWRRLAFCSCSRWISPDGKRALASSSWCRGSPCTPRKRRCYGCRPKAWARPHPAPCALICPPLNPAATFLPKLKACEALFPLSFTSKTVLGGLVLFSQKATSPRPGACDGKDAAVGTWRKEPCALGQVTPAGPQTATPAVLCPTVRSQGGPRRTEGEPTRKRAVFKGSIRNSQNVGALKCPPVDA